MKTMAEGFAYMSGIMLLIMMTWCLAQAGSHRTANVVGQDTPASWLTSSDQPRDHRVQHQASSSAGSPELLPETDSESSYIASKLMVRSTRNNRPYDVPQIECPPADEGVMERFACPTPDRMGRYRCIDDHVLCNGFIDCPNGEDEDRHACMFYKTTKAHLDILADALLKWARGR